MQSMPPAAGVIKSDASTRLNRPSLKALPDARVKSPAAGTGDVVPSADTPVESIGLKGSSNPPVPFTLPAWATLPPGFACDSAAAVPQPGDEGSVDDCVTRPLVAKVEKV